MVTLSQLRQYVPTLREMSASDIMDLLIEGNVPIEVKNVLLDRFNILSGRQHTLTDPNEIALVDSFMRDDAERGRNPAELIREGQLRYSASITNPLDQSFTTDDLASHMESEEVWEVGSDDAGPELPRPAVAQVIPTNPDVTAVKDNTSRFSGAQWFDKIKSTDVLLAGVGGIGSYVAFLLARLDVRSLTLYDDDRVEAVNMSGQLFQSQNIGTFKVDAVANTLNSFSAFHKVSAYREKFVMGKTPKQIMICGFDNMAARKDYFRSWKQYVMSLAPEERKNCLYIDGRLAAEELQVFAITGEDTFYMQKYETDWLFSDEEAAETLCSYKQTTFMANMIGSIMVNLFVNHAANLSGGFRDMPFLTAYSADTMFFKTES